MAASDILKNFAIFVDGRGYAGECQSYTPPALAIQTEDFRAGGMDAPIRLDMGMEALECSFVLNQYSAEVLALFGVSEGSRVPFVGRGALESYDGTVKPVAHTMRGKITRMERAEWRAGQAAPLTISMALDYYKEEIAGVVISEIDVINMVRVVNGVDRQAAIRAAIGA